MKYSSWELRPYKGEPEGSLTKLDAEARSVVFRFSKCASLPIDSARQLEAARCVLRHIERERYHRVADAVSAARKAKKTALKRAATLATYERALVVNPAWDGSIG